LRLDLFDSTQLNRGRPAWFELIWLLVQALFVRSWVPGAWHRRIILRLFGARLGKDVNIKPGVHIKMPWRLEVGDHSWIGENVWIDNMAPVVIGNHCCLSQGVYLCTGSHDWEASGFDLITAPITICDKAWLGAKAVVGPGVTVGEGAVLALGSVATRDLKPWWVYRGNPAGPVKERKIRLPHLVQENPTPLP
jgi:putative colanic acid biosynthesis acetyltransferase WcaF